MIVFASYQKFVKELQLQLWQVIFTNFWTLFFGGFLQYDPTSSFVRFVHIVSGLFCFASTVVPQQLSQKAFEKLATNQDLSNAIEKVSKDDDVDFYGSSLLPW